MPRETKFDLQCKIDRLERELSEVKRQLDLAIGEPGIIDSRWEGRYLIQQASKGSSEFDLWDIAAHLLASGDFCSEENTSHEHLVFSSWDELPPNVDALYVRYQYSGNDGIIIDKVWPARKL